MAVLPEIAELFQTSTAFILHGVEPASEELASLRKEVAELRVFVTDNGARLDAVQAALVLLGEDVTSVLSRLVTALPEAPADGADAPAVEEAPPKRSRSSKR